MDADQVRLRLWTSLSRSAIAESSSQQTLGNGSRTRRSLRRAALIGFKKMTVMTCLNNYTVPGFELSRVFRGLQSVCSPFTMLTTTPSQMWNFWEHVGDDPSVRLVGLGQSCLAPHHEPLLDWLLVLRLVCFVFEARVLSR